MKTTIKVKGLDLLNISRGLKRNVLYNEANLKPDSPLKGQKYSSFNYEGVMFTAPDMKGFDADYQAGKIKELTLVTYTEEVKTKDADGKEVINLVKRIDYVTHINSDQYKAFKKSERDEEFEDAKHDLKMNMIREGKFSKLDDLEDLDAVEEVAKQG